MLPEEHPADERSQAFDGRVTLSALGTAEEST
jgi:hypothetical protein